MFWRRKKQTPGDSPAPGDETSAERSQLSESPSSLDARRAAPPSSAAASLPTASGPGLAEPSGEVGSADIDTSVAAGSESVSPEASESGSTSPGPTEPPSESSNAAAEEPSASADGDPAPQVTEDQVVAALREVFDPEIPVNIYELGLIYAVNLQESETRPGGTDVDVKMTLTSPHCPVAETLPVDVARAVRTVGGVGEVDVEVVWDPTWNPDMMSEAAKLELGMF